MNRRRLLTAATTLTLAAAVAMLGDGFAPALAATATPAVAPAIDGAAAGGAVIVVLKNQHSNVSLRAQSAQRTSVTHADQQAIVSDITAQDPAASPLVVEAARGGSPALLVRPEDPGALGDDASGAPVLVRADVTSLLCVPLIAAPGEPVQGVLTLFRSAGRLAFSMAEARALDVMSRHIALAMRR